MTGGAGRAARTGRAATPHQPNCSKAKDNLTNDTFYKKKTMKDFKVYEYLHNDIGNGVCFNNLNEFKIIFNNYYKVWLFWINVDKNLNEKNLISADANDKKIEESLKHFIAIENILENTQELPANDANKWTWDDNLKKFIKEIFSNNKIKKLDIQKDFKEKDIEKENLLGIFFDTTGSSAQTKIDAIRNTYNHVKDIVCRIKHNDFSGLTNNTGTNDNEFFGVKEWDANVGSNITGAGTCSYVTPTGVAEHLFNTYIEKLNNKIDINDTTYYPSKIVNPNPTAQQAQQAPQAPQTLVATMEIQSYITKANELKDKIDANYLIYQFEYFDFLDSILMGLKKQVGTGIIAVNQTKIKNLLDRLEAHINANTTLPPSEIANYKAEIAFYNGWYLQPL
jgi:hypothetical protein